MRRDVIGIDFRYVPREAVSRCRGKVRYVCLHGELIPLTREHASTAMALKPLAHAANSGKKIDESESGLLRFLFEGQREQSLAYGISEVGRRGRLANYPTADGSLFYAKRRCDGVESEPIYGFLDEVLDVHEGPKWKVKATAITGMKVRHIVHVNSQNAMESMFSFALCRTQSAQVQCHTTAAW